MMSSTVPSPWPPCSSPMKMPGHPSSQSSFQVASSYFPASASSRTRSILKRSASSSFAVRLMACWSSEKSKFTIALPLSQLRQAEHPLGDDVLEDLGGAALDRVGPRAQQPVGPWRLPVRPLLAEDLDGELGQRLVDLAPLPLRERALRPGHAALHDLGEATPGVQPQQLDLDRQLGQLLADHRVLVRAAPIAHDEVGQALVLGRFLAGAPHEHAPLPLVGVGGPPLRAGQEPLAVL